MTLPGSNIVVEDFGLGIIEAGGGKTALCLGVSVGLANNQVAGFGAKQSAIDALIGGPLLEAVVSKLAAGASQVVACRVKPTTLGTAGAVTHTGTGAGTVAVATAPHEQIIAKITTPGVLGTMAVAFSYDGGVTYGTPVLSTVSSFVYDVPNTFLRPTFAAGTYVLDSTYTFNTDGTVTVGGGGINTVTQASSPLDSFDVIVEIMSNGALGAATFRYSLDGGDTYSGEMLIPSGGVKVLDDLAATGLVLTFASTFVDGDTYAFSATAPSYSVSDASAAMDAAILDTSKWSMVHIVGATADSAGAATLWATIETKMQSAAAAHRYARAMIECPQTEADSTIKAAFASLAGTRTAVACGDFEHTSPLTGRINRRNAAWAAMARAVAIDEGEALHFVGRGSLPQVKSLYRDEDLTPGLDDARFLTLRTFPGYAGYYVTRGRIMAPGGSDYSFWQNGRVIDRASEIAYAITMPLVGAGLRVDQVTGKLLETEARRIEKRVKTAIDGDLLARGQISASAVVVNRDTNVLATQGIEIEVGVVPLSYSDFITNTMRLVNPAAAA